MPAIVPPAALSDATIWLRPYAERDIPEILIAHQDDPELHLSRGVERPPSGAELGRAAELAPQAAAEGRGISLTICDAGADVCLGQVTLQEIDWRHRRGEVGLWLAPQARRRGRGPRALRLACAWALDPREGCDLERLAVITEPENQPMLATAAAAGFQREGVLRGYTLERGRRVDCVILSLLRGELRP